jgi:large subunit ribosomal protein L30
MGSIKVKLVASTEGRTPAQRGTIVGLGLKKLNSTKLLKDTKEIRGMIAKVAHMVTAEDVAGEAPKRKRTRRAKAENRAESK